MKRKRLQIALAIALFMALLGSVLVIWRGDLWGVFSDRERLVRWVSAVGAWGPIVIVVAEVLQVLLAPIPGQIVGLVAGYLYGAFLGTLYCSAGLALGSILAMWLARRLGRPLVERLVGRELLERIDGYAQRRGAVALFLIWLLPFLPDDLCCFVAGLTPLRLSELFILALVGRLPGVLVSTLIGAQAKTLTLSQMGIVALSGIFLAMLFVRYQERLEQAMLRVLDRFSAR